MEMCGGASGGQSSRKMRDVRMATGRRRASWAGAGVGGIVGGTGRVGGAFSERCSGMRAAFGRSLWEIWTTSGPRRRASGVRRVRIWISTAQGQPARGRTDEAKRYVGVARDVHPSTPAYSSGKSCACEGRCCSNERPMGSVALDPVHTSVVGELRGAGCGVRRDSLAIPLSPRRRQWWGTTRGEVCARAVSRRVCVCAWAEAGAGMGWAKTGRKNLSWTQRDAGAGELGACLITGVGPRVATRERRAPACGGVLEGGVGLADALAY